jgi:hypothetical protein
LVGEDEFILGKLTLYLQKDIWIANETCCALKLDDCIFRLKVWGQEIIYQEVLDQTEKAHGELHSATEYFLVQINNLSEEYVEIKDKIATWPSKR